MLGFLSDGLDLTISLSSTVQGGASRASHSRCLQISLVDVIKVFSHWSGCLAFRCFIGLIARSKLGNRTRGVAEVLRSILTLRHFNKDEWVVSLCYSVHKVRLCWNLVEGEFFWLLDVSASFEVVRENGEISYWWYHFVTFFVRVFF